MFEQLGLEPIKLAIQALNFLLLLFLLQRLAYRPLLRMMDARSARIRDDLDAARRVKEESRQEQEQYRQQLAGARDESRAILDEANAVAARIREQAQADATAQNAVTLGRAREEIAREKEQAIGELRREVADLAIMAASHVVGRSLDSEDQRRLVDQALSKVDAG
ncbi:MAG: F0F1 ATP synthase subunit B [Chloroflexota bacterium]|nr:F0F1 ATP synthase subunit B [Chloroflexota bacterium]